MESRLNQKIQDLQSSLQCSITANVKRIESDTKKSFSDAVKQNITEQNNSPNLRSIIKDARNEQQLEEREKRLRKNNIIIHGIADPISEDEDQMKQRDKEFTENLFKAIKVDVTPTVVQLIGKPEDHKKRPIKVIFNSPADKEKIMQSLKNLKNNESYNGMSIMIDLTEGERALYKSWTEKAKQKNLDEPSDSKFVWRVRGSPKNGLCRVVYILS